MTNKNNLVKIKNKTYVLKKEEFKFKFIELTKKIDEKKQQLEKLINDRGLLIKTNYEMKNLKVDVLKYKKNIYKKNGN